MHLASSYWKTFIFFTRCVILQEQYLGLFTGDKNICQFSFSFFRTCPWNQPNGFKLYFDVEYRNIFISITKLLLFLTVKTQNENTNLFHLFIHFLEHICFHKKLQFINLYLLTYSNPKWDRINKTAVIQIVKVLFLNPAYPTKLKGTSLNKVDKDVFLNTMMIDLTKKALLFYVNLILLSTNRYWMKDSLSHMSKQFGKQARRENSIREK